MSERSKIQTAQILAHLREHGAITSWDAIDKYAITRLAARISDLRKTNWIESVRIQYDDKNGDEANYVRYIYHGVIGEEPKEEREHLKAICKQDPDAREPVALSPEVQAMIVDLWENKYRGELDSPSALANWLVLDAWERESAQIEDSKEDEQEYGD